MGSRGLEPHVTSYSAVVDARAKSGDIVRAEQWMEETISPGVEPNIVSHSSMLDACARAKDHERAEHWLNEITERGCSPTPTPSVR